MSTLEQCIDQWLQDFHKKHHGARKTQAAQDAQRKDAISYCEQFIPVYENDENLYRKQADQEKAHVDLANAHNKVAEELNALGKTTTEAFDGLRE